MKLLKRVNLPLLILPILIFSLGYISLLSTSPERARDQLMFFVIGFLLYLAVSLIDYRIYSGYWKYIYALSLVLLLVTLVFGEVRYGSARWINLGFTSIQPSEFAKIALVIALPSFIVSVKSSIHSTKNLLLIAGIVFAMVFLVFVQPDLGTSLVLLAVLVTILFYAGLNRWFFILGLFAFGIFSSPLWNLLKDYQKERILVFLNPSLDILGSGYNVIQAVIAVGSGGWMGKGFGRGTQSQLDFLPAHWTDFAFASFAEEWGFVGVMLVLFFFAVILLTLIRTAGKVQDSLGSLIIIGTFAIFLVQFVVNVGMNLGVMPVTGIPLPFISYGGSSLLVSLVLLGLVQSVIIYSHEQSYRIS